MKLPPLNLHYLSQTITILCAFVLKRSGSVAIISNSKNVICNEVPQETLSEVLGGAFNSRYMSLTMPQNLNDTEEETQKRSAHEGLQPFYVEEADFSREVAANKPAWPRSKRSSRAKDDSDQQQWKCQSKLRWIDLGMDYFPRFLRTVECSTSNCWFNLFKCKARSFTVKILRRKRDGCVVAKTGTSLGMEGLPVDLRELWLWEERAIAFCCDCGL